MIGFPCSRQPARHSTGTIRQGAGASAGLYRKLNDYALLLEARQGLIRIILYRRVLDLGFLDYGGMYILIGRKQYAAYGLGQPI